MLKMALLSLAMISLTSCETESSRALASVCPPVVQYDRGFLAQAAAELQALPSNSAIEQLLKDYSVMRDQSRACSSRSFLRVGG